MYNSSVIHFAPAVGLSECVHVNNFYSLDLQCDSVSANCHCCRQHDVTTPSLLLRHVTASRDVPPGGIYKSQKVPVRVCLQIAD